MLGRNWKKSRFLKHSEIPNTHHIICSIQKSLVVIKVGIPPLTGAWPSVGEVWQTQGHTHISHLMLVTPWVPGSQCGGGVSVRVTRARHKVTLYSSHIWCWWPPGSPVSPGHSVSHCPGVSCALSRLAANTKPKQNSLIVKTNFYSLLMHAFNAFTSQDVREPHQLFCDHPWFPPHPLRITFMTEGQREEGFRSRQKNSVKPPHKSQHHHYISNGPFSFYHFSSSQKAHNWFLLTNSLFFRYVTSEL